MKGEEVMNHLQKLAIGLTHEIYRNTEIEDHHALGEVMDTKLFLWALDYFKEKFKFAMRRKVAIKAYKDDKYKKLFKYLCEYGDNPYTFNFIAGIYLFSINSDWDEPVEVEKKDPHETAYRYILSGRFFYHCNNHSKMTDEVMCDINKDVCNRIYTLLLSGYFG